MWMFIQVIFHGFVINLFLPDISLTLFYFGEKPENDSRYKPSSTNDQAQTCPPWLSQVEGMSWAEHGLVIYKRLKEMGNKVKEKEQKGNGRRGSKRYRLPVIRWLGCPHCIVYLKVAETIDLKSSCHKKKNLKYVWWGMSGRRSQPFPKQKEMKVWNTRHYL